MGHLMSAAESPRFALGHVVATAGALRALAFFDRDMRGDWGDLNE